MSQHSCCVLVQQGICCWGAHVENVASSVSRGSCLKSDNYPQVISPPVFVGDDYSFHKKKSEWVGNSWINWRRWTWSKFIEKKNHQSCVCWCRSSTEHHVSVSVFTLSHATVSHTHTLWWSACVYCCAVLAVTESVTGINSATSCLTARREVASSLATLWNKPKQSRIEWRTWMHF